MVVVVEDVWLGYVIVSAVKMDYGVIIDDVG